MSITFCTIASGSSGNSAFVSADSAGALGAAAGKINILIDAGLTGKVMSAAFISLGINPAELSAIFITHEHGDHIKGAGVLSRRYNLPIYLTKGTASHASTYRALGKIAPHNQFLAKPNVPITIGGVEIMPFDIPHDANEPVGYTITVNNAKGNSRKLAYATDLGHITPQIAAHMADADIIAIESNHDLNMLKNGPYPIYLKQRIAGPKGHLSNADCGAFLADIITPKTKHIVLAHLSQENNRPTLAFETVKNILLSKGIDAGGSVNLYIADRHRQGPLITISED
jgi:phosphoribosyl 1,2-cyclic phosphodiesterase